MSRKLELLLREWGDFNIKHMEYTEELGENILYRAGVLQGRVQDAPGKDKILCPDMPRHLQRVDIAIKRIPAMEQLALRVWYCAPLKDDGNPYTMGQLANKARMSLLAFSKKLKSGRRNLKKSLHTV